MDAFGVTDGILHARRVLESDVLWYRSVIRTGNDDARGMLKTAERMRSEDRVHRVKGHAVPVSIDVVCMRRKLIAEAPHDLVRVAGNRQDTVPRVAV